MVARLGQMSIGRSSSCREEEAVAELEDALLERELEPHQLQEFLGHEPVGRAQVRRR